MESTGEAVSQGEIRAWLHLYGGAGSTGVKVDEFLSDLANQGKLTVGELVDFFNRVGLSTVSNAICDWIAPAGKLERPFDPKRTDAKSTFDPGQLLNVLSLPSRTAPTFAPLLTVRAALQVPHAITGKPMWIHLAERSYQKYDHGQFVTAPFMQFGILDVDKFLQLMSSKPFFYPLGSLLKDFFEAGVADSTYMALARLSLGQNPPESPILWRVQIPNKQRQPSPHTQLVASPNLRRPRVPNQQR